MHGLQQDRKVYINSSVKQKLKMTGYMFVYEFQT